MHSRPHMCRCFHLIGRSQRGTSPRAQTSLLPDSLARTSPVLGSAKVSLAAQAFFSTKSPDWRPSQPQFGHLSCSRPMQTRTCVGTRVFMPSASSLTIALWCQGEFDPPIAHIFLENVRNLTGMPKVWRHVLKSLHKLGYEATLQTHKNKNNSRGHACHGSSSTTTTTSSKQQQEQQQQQQQQQQKPAASSQQPSASSKQPMSVRVAYFTCGGKVGGVGSHPRRRATSSKPVVLLVQSLFNGDNLKSYPTWNQFNKMPDMLDWLLPMGSYTKEPKCSCQHVAQVRMQSQCATWCI